MSEQWSKIARASIVASLAVAIGLVVSCGDSTLPAANGDSPMAPSGGSSCATPQAGCACTPGSVVACGERVDGDKNFIYCYEGTRQCLATGVFGECEEGAVVTKALSGALLHTASYGSPTPCMGLVDPCDPYCQVTSDTALGLDAGGAFVLSDGGLVPSSGCGNGVLTGAEACDDGNLMNGDGCSSTCALEPGYQCPVPGSACTLSTCGNGITEGSEQCDDGNLRPYDGCSPTCTREFNCPAPTGATAAPCLPVCGDGIKFPTEQCDDGNLRPGDGCDPSCNIEMGATCVTVTSPPTPTIDVPAIYRDFTPTHPDFQSPAPHAPFTSGPCVGGPALCVGAARLGIPAVTLAADKEPVLSTTQGCVGSAATFFQWYHDTPGVNDVILGKSLRLRNVAGSYVLDTSADPAYNQPTINCGNALPSTTCSSLGGFFPINGLGFGNYAATGRNFHFTSEVRYPFTYAGGETLSFLGDDDVYVYIGGKKVVDLGGIHNSEAGSVTLGPGTNTLPPSSPIGLVIGSTYEITVFQAERNTVGSNYKLTLQGFNRQISQCTVPAPPQTFVRDFEGVCQTGEAPVWQLFRWKATAALGSSISFRAATADTEAALPAAPPAAAPATVPIGTADSTTSPITLPVPFRNDQTNPPLPAMPVPIPVSQHLTVEGMGQVSKHWLRVYMTFSGVPTLFEWQQLYDCVPSE